MLKHKDEKISVKPTFRRLHDTIINTKILFVVVIVLLGLLTLLTEATEALLRVSLKSLQDSVS